MITIYLRLAFNAIKKNKALYIPYIFATSILGIIYYLISSLSYDKYVRGVQGGRTISEVLGVGRYVICAFAFIFILYLSVFISRKRKTEYGVLSVLGMEKKHLIGLIFVENVILAIGAVVVSVLGGISFYKIFQSLLLKTLDEPIDKSWKIYYGVIAELIAIYLITYIIVLIIQAIGILRKKTIDVIKSSSKGEKMRKIDYVIGILGIIGLVIAYSIAYGMADSYKATEIEGLITKFAGDVVLVIVATFLFFASGSALILTLFRAIKSFYYKKTNFIVLSGLSFRMRKNGIGLASICILFTMVIVSVAGLASFYSIIDPATITNQADNLIITDVTKFEYDENDEIESISLVPGIDDVNKLKEVAKAHNVLLDIKTIDFTYYSDGYIKNGKYYVDYRDDKHDEDTIIRYSNSLTYDTLSKFVSEPIELKDNQIGVIFPLYLEFDEDFVLPEFDTVVMPNGDEYELVRISEEVSFAQSPSAWDAVFFIFPCSEEELLDIMQFSDFIDNRVKAVSERGLEKKFNREFFESVYNPYYYSYYINMDTDYYEQLDILKEAGMAGVTYTDEFGNEFEYDVYPNQAEVMVEFYDTYKGITFVAVALIVIFVMISILVLYYKNVFDAFDDLKNFQIMRKVGLDESLVHKCVYIQMIISTLLPIMIAAIHTLFAEKFIKALISMFDLKELQSFGHITLEVALVSIVVYLFIGVIVGRVYLNIIKQRA